MNILAVKNIYARLQPYAIAHDTTSLSNLIDCFQPHFELPELMEAVARIERDYQLQIP